MAAHRRLYYCTPGRQLYGVERDLQWQARILGSICNEVRWRPVVKG
jgi:hypothetical protein